MGRIVYLAFPQEITGGQKTIFRHVETLNGLGFDAVYWTNAANRPNIPSWLSQSVSIAVNAPFEDDDILVVPEDAPTAIKTVAQMPQRSFIFCQNHFYFASIGMDAVHHYQHRTPSFLACSQTVASCLNRAFPGATVEIIPAFVNGETFHPRDARQDVITFMPRKRRMEARIIRNLFDRYYPDHHDFEWMALEGLHENAVAQRMGQASLFLSLSRFEALGLSALEAMLSGCVVAGFPGVGGREFARPDNGFWVEDDDCEAAVHALARAAALVKQGGAPLGRHIEASRAAAQAWSYSRFRDALEDVWSRLAPEARRMGPRVRAQRVTAGSLGRASLPTAQPGARAVGQARG